MKILLSLVLMSLVLMGCDRIEGQLNITKELKLTSIRGDVHTLKVGTYNADIQANSGNKMTLRLNKDSNEKFIFNHNGNIPQNGEFTIPANVSGQPVDLKGLVTTKVTESPVKDMYESCTYQRPVQICNPTPNGTVCTIQYQTVFGSHWLRFFDRQTDKNVSLSINTSGSADQSADFHGDISYLERIIVNQSNCM